MTLPIPYFIVALLYVLPIRLFVDYESYQGQSLINLIVNHVILGKDIGHLWYLQALFNIFVIFHSIERGLRKVPIRINLIVLFVISVFSLFLPGLFNIQATLSYFIYFYLGYSVREAKINNNAIGATIGVMSILQFTGLLFRIMTYQIEENVIVTGLSLGFNVIGSVFSCLFFYLLFTKISKSSVNLYKNMVIQYIDSKSFGIYLFHSPLLYIALYYLSDKMVNPFVMVSLLFVVMFFGSIAITNIVEKSDNLGFIIGKSRYKKK